MNELINRAEGKLVEYLDPGEEFRTSYDQLRPAERYFVDAYTATLDPKLAARSWNRGTPNSSLPADTLAADYLRRPLVKAAIAEIFAQRRQRYSHELDRLKSELAAIAFASQSDYIRLDINGEPYYDLTGISAEAMSAISEITIEDFKEGRGENSRDIRRVRLKLHDKLGAIKLLAQLNGAMTGDTNTVNVQINSGGVAGPVRQINGITPAMTTQQAAEAYQRSLEDDDQ